MCNDEGEKKERKNERTERKEDEAKTMKFLIIVREKHR